MERHIAQHWSAANVALSYLIAVTGSFCTIQLMEQWRMHHTSGAKLLHLVLSAFTLGGCGIWCTHFTGMTALDLVLDDGTSLEIHFEVGLTVLSFVFPVAGVYAGLKIASADPFFLEIEATRRKDLLVQGLAKNQMRTVVRKSSMARIIKNMALFSRLWHILGGALFAALGVLSMHYLGMLAQRTNARMEFNGSIIGLSCVIAFGTATAAFWILFRAHTFWPDNDSLHIASALIMGIAVCGTHYTGMGAATYFHTAEDYSRSERFVISGWKTSIVASHTAILLCYWLTSVGVTKSVKIAEAQRYANGGGGLSTLAAPMSRTTGGRNQDRYNRRDPRTAAQATANGSRTKVYLA